MYFVFQHLASLVTALKIILIYVKSCEKRNSIKILKDMRVIKSGKLDFIILDRYNFCRASTILLDRKDFVETFVGL